MATFGRVNDAPPVLIRARSEQQAMDWSLVLVSQGIACGIGRDPGSGKWQVEVPAGEHPRALETLRLFNRESRRSRWEHPLPDSELNFHAGVLLWVLALSLVHAAGAHLSGGTFEFAAAARGEWWRALTAVWLHADLAHLASNAMMGTLFLGLAMARYGAGIASLTGLLGGAGANLLALRFRLDHPGYGLGASGMVMAALGMMAVQALPLWRHGRRGTRVVLAGLAGGSFLFIQLGTSLTSDVLAHAGGFVIGIVLGGAWSLLPERWMSAANRWAWVVFWPLVLTAWARVPFR